MTAIEALEAYTSDHPETVEQLLEWPYRRFSKAFEAWQRRRASERIERQEDLHIAAMYSNTNLDEADNDRAGRIQQVQDFYRQLRRQILDGVSASDEELEPPDPQAEAFMRAGKRNLSVIVPDLPNEGVLQGLM